MRNTLIITLLLACISSLAQDGFYVSAGYGAVYSKGKLEPLQKSYDSYVELTRRNYPNDVLNPDKTFVLTQVAPVLTIQGGFRYPGSVILGAGYQRIKMQQELYAMRESGYGRKFLWKEKRSQILMDLGYSGEKIGAIGTFGVETAQYTMGSYQVYPDGTESLGNEFPYNGNFRQQDVGITYGLGLKYTPKPYICVDLRYLHTTSKLPGETNVGTDLSITDNSLSRLDNSNASTEFPADWNKTAGFNNAIYANFARTYYQLTVSYQFNFNY